MFRKIFLTAVAACAGMAFAQPEGLVIPDRPFYNANQSVDQARFRGDLKGLLAAAEHNGAQYASPEEIVKYTDLAARACAGIVTTFREEREAARNVADKALSHIDAVTSGTATLPIEAFKDYWTILGVGVYGRHGDFFRHVDQSDAQWRSARREIAALPLLKLSMIEKAMDPGWSEALAQSISPMPPPPREAPIQLHGMSPASIKDPRIRAKYEAAIRENTRLLKWSQDQSVLHDERRVLLRNVESSLTELYSTPPYDNDELAALFEDYETSPPLAAKIMDAVKAKTQ